jgi:hypothetical protein
VHGHVVLAKRDVIERLAIHVDDELSPTFSAGVPVKSCSIPEASMATWPAGLRKISKIVAAGAGIGRVTSIRSDRKTVSGMWGSLWTLVAS